MRENGTDRDLALAMVAIVDDISTALDTIISNNYSPHITTQPSDVTLSVNETATFTLVATNARAYQWQVKQTDEGPWSNVTSVSGYNTPSMSIVATQNRFAYTFRCEVTGLDNSKVYSDPVKMIAEQ